MDDVTQPSNSDKRKPYEKPQIILEVELETRAGSPIITPPPSSDSLDLLPGPDL